MFIFVGLPSISPQNACLVKINNVLTATNMRMVFLHSESDRIQQSVLHIWLENMNILHIYVNISSTYR